MSRIFKPAQPPPDVDRFCHLSSDAQKVMAAIHKQYQQQRQKVVISEMDRQASQGPSRYYQSIYSARFGSVPGTLQSSQCWKIKCGAGKPECNLPESKGDNIIQSSQRFENRGSYLTIQEPYQGNKTFLESCNEKGAAFLKVQSLSQDSCKKSVAVDSTYQRSSQDSLPLSLSPSLFPSLEMLTDLDRGIIQQNKTVETASDNTGLSIDSIQPAILGSRGFDQCFKVSSDVINVKRKTKPDAENGVDITEKHQKLVNNDGYLALKNNTEKHSSFILPLTRMHIVNKVITDSKGETTTKAIGIHLNGRNSYVCNRASDQSTKENMCSISKRILEHKFIRKEIEEKENKSPAATEKANKRKISTFFAPYKKNKVPDHNRIDKNMFDVADRVIDITCIDIEDRDAILHEVKRSREILLAIVYEDSGNQLRNSLDKKKTQNLKSRSIDQIRSIRIGLIGDKPTMKTGETQVTDMYSIPNVWNITNIDWIRSFWDTVFCCPARKICFGAKELFITLVQCIYQDPKVCVSDWTVLDPQIASWLLDPDNPPTSFEVCLKSVSLFQEKKDVMDCCELLTVDFTLLSTMMSRLYHKLQKRELWELYYSLETKLVPLLANMECQTLEIDTDKLVMFSDALKRKLQKLEQKAHKSVGHSFLINSPAQLRQVLFEELRLDTKLPQKNKLAKTSVGHQISTSESVLQQLIDIHPLPGLILEYRQFQKLKSTYMDGIMSCVQNGCLSTHWDQISAATGRLSSYQPNIQAIPKTPILVTNYKDNFIIDKENAETLEIFARDIFKSQTGWSFMAADFQQIELRLLAHLADDDILLKIFKNQEATDIFMELTSQWLGKAVIDITSTEREQTKRIVYSVMYGAGKEKLAEYLKISADNAKAIMNSFLVKFPAVNLFSKKCVEFCQRHGYTSTIFKRKRMIPNINHKSPPLRAQAERQAVNFCVQGSAADLCKAAMLQIEQSLRNHKHLRARQLFQIHDELLLEVHDEDISAVTSVVKSVMENSKDLCGSIVTLKVPVRVSISVGKTWGHMAPIDK